MLRELGFFTLPTIYLGLFMSFTQLTSFYSSTWIKKILFKSSKDTGNFTGMERMNIHIMKMKWK